MGFNSGFKGLTEGYRLQARLCLVLKTGHFWK